jgi:phospholipid/cholesterol/gamma-HCH transport system substrate-binding protein
MFAQTTAPIRDQIRPFTRQIRPVLTHAAEGSTPLSKTVRNFGNGLGGFNTFLNELAYKPKGKQSFLFYLPWLNHNFNASFNLQDAGGPILRGMVLITCTGTSLAYGTVAPTHPFIKTLLQGASIPRADEIPVSPEKSDTGFCQYKEKE